MGISWTCVILQESCREFPTKKKDTKITSVSNSTRRKTVVNPGLSEDTRWCQRPGKKLLQLLRTRCGRFGERTKTCSGWKKAGFLVDRGLFIANCGESGSANKFAIEFFLVVKKQGCCFFSPDTDSVRWLSGFLTSHKVLGLMVRSLGRAVI